MEIDRILANELAKVAANAADVRNNAVGAVSRKYVGIPALDRAAAHLGASVAARFLPNNEHRITKKLAMDAGQFLQKAFDVLNTEGNIIEDIGQGIERPALAAVTGAGFSNLNPAVVQVTIDEIAEDGITVTVTGVAKEGLIKQYAGEKAAKRIAEKLL